MWLSGGVEVSIIFRRRTAWRRGDDDVVVVLLLNKSLKQGTCEVLAKKVIHVS